MMCDVSQRPGVPSHSGPAAGPAPQSAPSGSLLWASHPSVYGWRWPPHREDPDDLIPHVSHLPFPLMAPHPATPSVCLGTDRRSW